MQTSDLNAFVYEHALFEDSQLIPKGWRGRLFVRLDVSKVQDIRSLQSVLTYHVQCTVRVRIFSATAFKLALEDVSSWNNYPAALINTIEPSIPDAAIYLVDYVPKTINTSVNSDSGLIKTTDQSFTRSYTAGSANTVTNTFGVNLGVDAEGNPTAGGHFEHSEMSETRNERTRGGSRGASTQLSNNASMTIKDWASYAFVAGATTTDPAPADLEPRTVTWIWAQEYPWDALILRPVKDSVSVETRGMPIDFDDDDDTLEIVSARIPHDVAARLFPADKIVSPPSHLSQMGLDLVSKVTWLVTPTKFDNEPQLTLTLSGSFWQGSHDSGTQSIKLAYSDYPKSGDKLTVSPVFLERLSLLPITETGTSNGAVLAFAANDFPQPYEAGNFSIATRANKLLANGRNFVRCEGNSNGITANVPAGVDPTDKTPSLTLYFKVLDLEVQYDLVLKHWIKSASPAVTLSVYINPPLKDGKIDLTNLNPQAIRYVTELEGEGGDNNVTAIALRDLSFGTADYHDYLKLGLNTIYVTITAAAQQQYVLRALAIG